MFSRNRTSRNSPKHPVTKNTIDNLKKFLSAAEQAAESEDLMEFFNSAVDTLQTIVVGLGGALCVWGGINLLEGYGQDTPGSNAHVR